MGIGGITSGKYFTGYKAQSLDKSAAAKNFASRMKEGQVAYLASTLSVCHKGFTGSIKTVETERYKIVEKDSGVLHVYDKKHNNEGIDLKLNKEQIQVDKETGTKFIINDLGAGFFTMVAVDAELEAGLKEALGVDELDEKELTGFKVHTDQKTGIQYITANGYESRGGLLVLDKEAMQKLDSMAKEFLEQYPRLAKTYNEAWFYATFEVRGLLQRIPNGIIMISPNSISFRDKDGENRWTGIFDEQSWQSVKKEFDSNTGDIRAGKWSYWESLLKKKNINCSLIIPDEEYPLTFLHTKELSCSYPSPVRSHRNQSSQK